jgi:hypothetical protein
MDMQGWIVLALALAAAAFLARQVLRGFLGSPASPACHGCPTACELKTAARQTGGRAPCHPEPNDAEIDSLR